LLVEHKGKEKCVAQSALNGLGKQGFEIVGVCGSKERPGFPDLVVVRPPTLLFAGLKGDTGRLRPEQRAWLESLKRCPQTNIAPWSAVAGWAKGISKKAGVFRGPGPLWSILGHSV
jgi:VRR-NUC domain